MKDGEVLARAMFSLDANGQSARFLREIFPDFFADPENDSFRGSVKLWSIQPDHQRCVRVRRLQQRPDHLAGDFAIFRS